MSLEEKLAEITAMEQAAELIKSLANEADKLRHDLLISDGIKEALVIQNDQLRAELDATAAYNVSLKAELTGKLAAAREELGCAEQSRKPIPNSDHETRKRYMDAEIECARKAGCGEKDILRIVERWFPAPTQPKPCGRCRWFLPSEIYSCNHIEGPYTTGEHKDFGCKYWEKGGGK